MRTVVFSFLGSSLQRKYQVPLPSELQILIVMRREVMLSLYYAVYHEVVCGSGDKAP
jgi:hypothetical protein